MYELTNWVGNSRMLECPLYCGLPHDNGELYFKFSIIGYNNKYQLDFISYSRKDLGSIRPNFHTIDCYETLEEAKKEASKVATEIIEKFESLKFTDLKVFNLRSKTIYILDLEYFPRNTDFYLFIEIEKIGIYYICRLVLARSIEIVHISDMCICLKDTIELSVNYLNKMLNRMKSQLKVIEDTN